MKTGPIWKTESSKTDFPQLTDDLNVDIAIIGGGITGITTAQLLKKKGYSIAVLESRRVGQGTSGQSTGNLYAVTEYPKADIEEKYDLKTLKEVVESRNTALDFIKNTIQQFNIDCDFHHRSMFIFENDGKVDIDKEIDLAKEIGIQFSPLQDNQFPFPFNKGIEYLDQAQFNPLRYVQQIAKHIHGGNCNIYENTRVIEIEEEAGYIELKTEQTTVRAKYVVHATHTPMGLQVPFHTNLGPYREYGIGIKLKGNQYPNGIYWGYFGNKKYSVRSYTIDNEPYLICVGNMHKVGQADNNHEQIRDLIDFVSNNFEVDHITHQWGGQNYKSADLLPYIGAKSKGSNQYIATGFSTDGLVYGVLAGKLIADEIMGTSNPYMELYKASRHQPLKAAKKFTKENLNVAAQLIKDMPLPGFDSKDIELKREEGKVVQVDGKKLAIYKDSVGSITALSAVCPHMGCIVNWNSAEHSWDCPCHGSRFNITGSVIEGPAFNGLDKANLE